MSKRKNDCDDQEGKPEPKLASIFANASQRLRGVWKVVPDQLFIYTVDGIEHQQKIAAFDLDGTLIKTKSGNTFARSGDDWQFWSSKVVGALRKCHSDAFKLCIFTNQKGIRKGLVDAGQFKRKVQNIVNAIGVPLQVFVSVGTANYRKPYVGMWNRMENEENGAIWVDREGSFYVGDAAGRLKTQNRPKNDHSCADRLFALNLSLNFQTPEQFFAKISAEEPFRLPEFNASQLLREHSHQFNPKDFKMSGTVHPELVVLVGSPASGKSTFARRFKNEYVILSQDELGTRKKCLDQARESLRKGKSVIIDNTNRDAATRKDFCDLAASFRLPCRCLLFACSPAHALHNNTFRQVIAGGEADRSHDKVNEMVLRTFFSAYQKPTETEGFSEIIQVNFVPEFEREEHRQIYAMYLSEK
uniref:Bifunctional polynucleotide phosphatase/kinase n=1 Tax=Globodera rostochiensis TaxID=31243 RepID=A0A914HY63_GLORO